MYRYFDWRCSACGAKRDGLVDVPCGDNPPKTAELFCGDCDREIEHDRIPSVPAPYTGEHVRNPHVYGGQCDTMGCRQLPPLPDLPGAKEHERVTMQKLAALPKSAPQEERYSVLREAGKSAPSSSDYSTMFAKPEYREVERERVKVIKENAQKKKRAKALKSGGTVNFRRDKCAGDPVI